MTTRRILLKSLAAGTLAASAFPGRSQDGTITVFVGAASSMDFTARVIADQLRDALGRTVISQSKLGAGQRLALGEAKRAAPDGRTLVFATSGPFAIYPHIYTKLDYDPVADFTPIAGVSTFDVGIATGPMTGAQDMQQLVAWAKTKGADAVFGSAPGNGSLSHFLGISVGLATRTPMTHVPYKDSGVGMIDLAAGRLPILITGLAPMLEMHRSGKIKIVAVSGEQRSNVLPDVPTVKEAGVNVSSTTSTGLFGPAKMAPELVARLHAALQPMFSNPAVKEKLAAQGMTLWPVNGQQLAQSLVEERKRFEGLVKASGYVAEAS